MINNIVFDMGGVLAKIHPERAIRSFEAKIGRAHV